MLQRLSYCTLYLCFIFLTFLVSSCENTPEEQLQIIEVKGRSERARLTPKLETYRMMVPQGWEIEFPPDEDPLLDTTMPLLTLRFGDVVAVFHNFPAESLEQRIPPIAQVTRWKKQFESLSEPTLQIFPFATSGFTGLQFEAVGIQKNEPIKVLAWSMQLTPELFQRLPEHASQQKGDWTLKASGPPDQLEMVQEDLFRVARSIELLEELSQR